MDRKGGVEPYGPVVETFVSLDVPAGPPAYRDHSAYPTVSPSPNPPRLQGVQGLRGRERGEVRDPGRSSFSVGITPERSVADGGRTPTGEDPGSFGVSGRLPR